MTIPTTPTGRRRGDQGASLILAIVFVFAVGLVLVAIGGFATGALRNTSNFHDLRTSEANAEAATTVALRFVQTTYKSQIYSGGSSAVCLPTASVDAISVYCAGTASISATPNRVVDFYACSSPACSQNAPSVIIHARVAYSDRNFAGQDTCPSDNATCGAGVSILTWDVIHADT
jgi:hypothetical protein